MINGEAQVVVCREVGLRAREQVGNSRSVRGYRFRSGLFETSQRGSIGAFKFEATEERNQAFAEHRIIRDMISDMGPLRLFGFFASQLCEDEEASAIAGSIAEG